MVILEILVESIWLILPAYASNGLVPIFKGKHPLDFDKKFIDKNPILGKGKTWEGLFIGIFFGVTIAVVEMLAFQYLPWHLSPKIDIVTMSIQLGFLLGAGSMIGDIIGSFIKRRFGMKRGESAPILDQLDFLLGALLFASLIVQIKILWIILLVLLTPILHIAANKIAYIAKIKKEPW